MARVLKKEAAAKSSRNKCDLHLFRELFVLVPIVGGRRRHKHPLAIPFSLFKTIS